MPLQIEVLGTGPVVRPEPGADCDYRLVSSIAELREYLRPALQGGECFGADWEGTGLNTLIAYPTALAVSTAPRTGRLVFLANEVDTSVNLPVPEVLQVLKDADAAKASSIWYNTLYDHELSEMALQWVPKYWHDAIHGVFLVDSNVLQLGLKESSMRFLGRKMTEISELDHEWYQLSKKEKKLKMFKLPHQLEPSIGLPYACPDADHTRQIWLHPRVQEAVREQSGILRLEELLNPVMRKGNRYGVYLDIVRLKLLRQEADDALALLIPEIHAQLGEVFELTRKQYLATKVAALLPHMAEKTKGGAPTVSVKILEKYKQDHPSIPLLIRYAQLVAQRDNYINKLARAHTYFSQQPWAQGRTRFAFGHIGVPTGRMKCGGGGKGQEAYLKGVADVNAQSIPDHEKSPGLPNTRSAFCAPAGFVVVAIDYNQVELRIPANLSREPKWIEAYQDPDGDIHVTNAQVVANIKEPGVVVTKSDKPRRGAAKTVGFALIYGGDEHTVARNAGISVPEAKTIFDAFFAGLPVLKGFFDSLVARAKAQKQIATFMGRIRRLGQYFPDRVPDKRTDFKAWVAWRKLVNRGEREAMNHPIQGGAADIFKTACILADRAVDAQGWGPDIVSPQVLWVHDELLWYVRQEWVTRVVPVLVKAMEFEIRGWPVPLKAEPEVGCRRLYYELQAEKAKTPEDKAEWAARLAALPEDQTGSQSTWGELVSYDTWVKRYAADQTRAA